MAIRGYLVLTDPGAAGGVAAGIAALPGCEVVPARAHDLLLLVTETASADEDRVLHERLEAVSGVAALMLTFGEVVPPAPPPAPRPG